MADSGGSYYEPTIFDGVNNSMRIAREEIFGPVMSVIGFNDAEEAVAIANDSIYGLAGAVWSNNINTAHRVAAAVRVGTMGINNYFGGDITVPFWCWRRYRSRWASPRLSREGSPIASVPAR